MSSTMPPDMLEAYRQVIIDLRERRRGIIGDVSGIRVTYIAGLFDLELTKASLEYILIALREIWDERDSGLRDTRIETLGQETRQLLALLQRLREPEPSHASQS